jgi:hypothetical protein
LSGSSFGSCIPEKAGYESKSRREAAPSGARLPCAR